METKYEVVNKDNGDIFPVDTMTMGEGYVDVSLNHPTEGVIGVRFDNTNADGNLENVRWAIRQVETDLTANNDGVVSDTGVETPVTPEQASDIETAHNTGTPTEGTVQA